MLDEKDLQAIAEIMDSKIGASEKRMAQLMAQQRRDIMQDVKTLLDTEVQTKFNLLAEGQEEILRRMHGLELGSVRAPMPGLIPEDEAVVAEAQAMIEAAIAKL